MILIGVFTFAIFLRVGWYLQANSEQLSDAAYYMYTGKQILKGQNWLSPHKQTGPSWIAAIGMLIAGETNYGASLLILLLSIFSVFLVYAISHALFDKLTAICSLFIYAIWPENILFSNVITNSFPQGIILILCLFLIFKVEKDRSQFYLPLVFFIGALLGLAQYLRGNSLFVCLSLGIWYLIFKYEFKKFFALFWGFLIVTTPLLNFNFEQGKIISFSPSQFSGFSFLIGTNVEHRGEFYWEGLPQRVENHAKELYSQGRIKNEKFTIYDLNIAASDLAKLQITSHPFEFFSLMINHKLPVFLNTAANINWSLEKTNFNFNASEIGNFWRVTNFFQGLLFTLTLMGTLLWIFPKEANPLLALSILLFGTILASHLVAEVQGTYHLSIVAFYPLAAGFAMAGILMTTDDFFKNYLKKLIQKFNLRGLSGRF